MYESRSGFRQSVGPVAGPGFVTPGLQRRSLVNFNEETQAGCALLGAMEYHVVAFLQSPSEGERRAPPKAKEEKAAERAEADERKNQA